MSDPRQSLVDSGYPLDELTPTNGPFHIAARHQRRIDDHEQRIRLSEECLGELKAIHRESTAASAERQRLMGLSIKVGLPIFTVLAAAVISVIGWALSEAYTTVEAIEKDVQAIELRLGPEKAEDE